MEEKLNGLDLATGCGELILALEPWVRPMVLAEDRPHAQALLYSRMVEGVLPRLPICTSLGHLDGDFFGGGIDIVTAIVSDKAHHVELDPSVEGKCDTISDQLLRLTLELRPAFVFVASGSRARAREVERFARSLADERYDSRWRSLSGHWFILAHRPTEEGQAWRGAEALARAPALAGRRTARRLARSSAIRPRVAPQLARDAFAKLLGIGTPARTAPLPSEKVAASPSKLAGYITLWEADHTVI